MVPISLKKEMLNKLHKTHMSIVKTQTRARELLFWPKMNQDIEDFIGQCAVCNKFMNSNCKEPLISQEMLSRPWSKVAADMFQFKGSEYLLFVDDYSKFSEIVRMWSTSSSQSRVSNLFARHGIPTELFTDNGPQFSSYAFKKEEGQKMNEKFRLSRTCSEKLMNPEVTSTPVLLTTAHHQLTE